MSEPQPDRPWGEGVLLSAPLMRSFSFRYEGEDHLPERVPLEFEWALEVYRAAVFSIGVDLTLRVRADRVAGETTYRLGFRLVEGSPEASDPDRALRSLAARAAPVTLYPYMRETFNSAAMRCGIPFVLPFQNVGALFSPEEVEVPPPPAGAEDFFTVPAAGAPPAS